MKLMQDLEFGTQRFASVTAPKRRSTRMWTSLQIGRGPKGSVVWLAGTATNRLLLSRNVCLAGTLEGIAECCGDYIDD